ncbi:2-dehydro-3-deoxygalactonokinase [Pseudooceanicola sp. CBS1P-1]|uniref:2-dehydro-3-deoxygalactonokinase n=1 Tax=Pseudooceanicola albus TaxID=2692189 RepID=A0A6L7FWY4_9RHOB|nr:MULTISPECIES: 2-dehydro-3-deoxygalactonokinase [Pseudooceanicola]MBT9383953.1 2-dehydro-3-deoxygalactonokinase [Pseudooceanicola endophyticus]MXN16634.1 hypothetical protein [Pseudooceanicola albus]
MNWQGYEIDAPESWGPEGQITRAQMPPGRTLVVGEPTVPGDALPGTLLPEALPSNHEGQHLPPLGGLSAHCRLRLLGFQTLNPHWDGLALVVKQTRTHWVTLSAGEVIHLQTSATGELAEALGCAATPAEGLDDAMNEADRLPFALAQVKAPGARLGLLIGAEMAAAKALWLGQQAVLIGQGPLARAYLAALQGLYVPVTETREEMLVREGFRALARKFLPQDDA